MTSNRSPGPGGSSSLDGYISFAETATGSALRDGVSERTLLKVIARFGELLDAQSSILGPCPFCACGGPARARVSELIAMQRLLDEMEEGTRNGLAQAAKLYREQTLLFRDGRMDRLRVECPCLIEGQCVFADARPMSARVPIGSPPNEAQIQALAMELGHAIGLCLAGLDHQQVEVGLALSKMLEGSGWVGEFLGGLPVFREEAIAVPLRDPIVERVKTILGRLEPSGCPDSDQALEKARSLVKEVGLNAALAVVPGVTATQRMWRVRLPYACASEDEIDESRAAYLQRLQEFSGKPSPPVEAFDALTNFHTFPLAYQGREVRSVLSAATGTIVEPIARKALPDLVGPIEGRRRPGPLRVGYISASLRASNGGYWSRGWLRNHGEGVETYAFLLSQQMDYGSLEFLRHASHFYQMPGDVPSSARFIKGLDLDLLIYTDIGMDGRNYQFAALRLARVQATAWGHPVTSCLSTIDYYLSSDLMEPGNGQDHYSETLVKLPGSGLFMPPPPPSGSDLTREHFGIDQRFVVLVPQNVMKLVPRWDQLFARVCEATGEPVTFVESPFPSAVRVVKERLKRAGVRAHWVPELKSKEFKRLVEVADVIIEPPAWTGGNTTLEAIASGKPVVTLPGEFMRGRHAMAFLKQAGMERLIARNEDEYVSLAANRDLQAEVMREANLTGPFNDRAAVEGLNAWIRALP